MEITLEIHCKNCYSENVSPVIIEENIDELFFKCHECNQFGNIKKFDYLILKNK